MEQLCRQVQSGGYAVLLSILRNPEDAADALQEALIRLVRFLPGLRTPSQFSGWMMRLLINQAHTARRKNTATVVDLMQSPDGTDSLVPAEPATPSSQSPRRIAASAELATYINQAVSELPPRQKSVLVLFELEQMSIREIAEVLELTDGAIKFHLHEARRNLRRNLNDLGISSDELIREESAL